MNPGTPRGPEPRNGLSGASRQFGTLKTGPTYFWGSIDVRSVIRDKGFGWALRKRNLPGIGRRGREATHGESLALNLFPDLPFPGKLEDHEPMPKNPPRGYRYLFLPLTHAEKAFAVRMGLIPHRTGPGQRGLTLYVGRHLDLAREQKARRYGLHPGQIVALRLLIPKDSVRRVGKGRYKTSRYIPVEDIHGWI